MSADRVPTECGATFDNVNMSAGPAYCNRQIGHSGAHRDRWRDRNRTLRIYCEWTDEDTGAKPLPAGPRRTDHLARCVDPEEGTICCVCPLQDDRA